MRYRSVRGGGPVPFQEALFRGIAEDGELYVPETIPRLPAGFVESLAAHPLSGFGVAMLAPFVDDISESDLDRIVRDAWNFEVPLVELEDGIHLLELFHGPTLAFKDIGARFMARVLSHYLERASRELSVLVATSGDTGSAVASGFHDVPRIRVFVLFPSGRISPLQEQQIATLGGNIHALEVDGSFDDCQRLVKQALADSSLRSRRELTTANSINVGRLLPQMAYYGWAMAQLMGTGASRPAAAPRRGPAAPHPAGVVVPSGNFGNLTAAVYARAMGIPIAWCAAATNANDVVPEYFRTGTYRPRPSVATLSNAMDVGNPSNLARLESFFGNDVARLREAIVAGSVDDDETGREMKRTFERTGRILDPHTAVGVAMARRLRARDAATAIIVPATAHPGKFPETVEKILGVQMPVPRRLEQAVGRPRQSVPMRAQYEPLREALS